MERPPIEATLKSIKNDSTNKGIGSIRLYNNYLGAFGQYALDLEARLKEAEKNAFKFLHDKIGICGHCNKRDCVGRQSHSILPHTISTEIVLEALKGRGKER